MTSLGKRYAGLKLRESEVQADLEKLRAEVRGLMDAEGVDVLDMDGFQARLLPAGVRRTVDVARMKADGVYDAYATTSETAESLRIRKR